MVCIAFSHFHSQLTLTKGGTVTAQILIDGVLKANITMVKNFTDITLTATVSAGIHNITVLSIGSGWYEVLRLTVR